MINLHADKDKIDEVTKFKEPRRINLRYPSMGQFPS